MDLNSFSEYHRIHGFAARLIVETRLGTFNLQDDPERNKESRSQLDTDFGLTKPAFNLKTNLYLLYATDQQLDK